jgi:hypothetical protein
MSELYVTLSEVRNSLVNVIGQMYLDGKPRNFSRVLESIRDEYTADEFVNLLFDMTKDELLDLGFKYINSEENNFMLIPIWVFPVIPSGVTMVDLNGNFFMNTGRETISAYGNEWVSAGWYLPVADINSDDEIFIG